LKSTSLYSARHAPIPLLSTWHELGDIHAGSGSIDNKELGDALSDLGMATTSEKIEVRIQYFFRCVFVSQTLFGMKWHMPNLAGHHLSADLTVTHIHTNMPKHIHTQMMIKEVDSDGRGQIHFSEY